MQSAMFSNSDLLTKQIFMMGAVRINDRLQQKIKCPNGFSLAEVLVAITLLMIMIVPAMNALSEGVLVAKIHQDEAGRVREIQNKMEEILARSFSKLDNEALGKNSSDTTAISFPLATVSSPPNPMDDSGYSDSKYDVYIFRCAKNASNTLILNNSSLALLCVQIKQKSSGIVLLQSAKTK
jgi:type II secretory pathway pseudopilin PulG